MSEDFGDFEQPTGEDTEALRTEFEPPAFPDDSADDHAHNHHIHDDMNHGGTVDEPTVPSALNIDLDAPSLSADFRPQSASLDPSIRQAAMVEVPPLASADSAPFAHIGGNFNSLVTSSTSLPVNSDAPAPPPTIPATTPSEGTISGSSFSAVPTVAAAAAAAAAGSKSQPSVTPPAKAPSSTRVTRGSSTREDPSQPAMLPPQPQRRQRGQPAPQRGYDEQQATFHLVDELGFQALSIQQLSKKLKTTLMGLFAVYLLFYIVQSILWLPLTPFGPDAILLFLGWYSQELSRIGGLELYHKLSLISTLIDTADLASSIFLIVTKGYALWIIAILVVFFVIEQAFKLLSVWRARALCNHLKVVQRAQNLE